MEKKGTTRRGITAVGRNEIDDPQETGPWKYWNGYAWTSGENDINVECIDGMYSVDSIKHTVLLNVPYI